ncbi:hypothetical protein PN36_10495 [Candidatus Thiomargarita nelsonii]|uniref:Uncharacterized protein n=1 Tax=Candidatus Thiomargarita nelsonii TaxID=1003181 RepID=A0A4E0QW63_9GAMM|nr:hypothetical protein PN36_10495 [Candidatus Thiomargarita nelsonii]
MVRGTHPTLAKIKSIAKLQWLSVINKYKSNEPSQKKIFDDFFYNIILMLLYLMLDFWAMVSLTTPNVSLERAYNTRMSKKIFDKKNTRHIHLNLLLTVGRNLTG